jgi:hypothetical protein
LASEDGVEIYKRFYPWPDRFRLGDPVLVKEVTGMRWPDFASALDEFDSSEPPDQVVLAGLIAVAFWQGNPQMSRDKARRALERIPMEEIEIVEGDEAPEDDAAPPAEAGGQPSATPSESNEPPGSSSDETSPNGSGNPLSPVTSQESDSQAA